MTPLADSPANERLLANVHPPAWSNPQPLENYNVVVLGAGTAGLVTAIGAAGLGAKVAMVERSLMGGDCLNVGCVPSKGVISAARAAAAVREAEAFGVHASIDRIDFAAAMERMRRLRADISPNDSATRFQEAGVDVFFGDAAFNADGSIAVQTGKGTTTLHGSRVVIATGARAFTPDVPGLADINPLTNETVFTLTEPPRRLLVLGGGPIGSELAQSFARLGVEVVLLEQGPGILSGDDPEGSAIVADQMRRDGVTIHLNTKLTRVEKDGDTVRCHLEGPGAPAVEEGSHLLVGVGRQPNVETLNLDAVGVKWDTRYGVEVDDSLRTANPRIWAAGDVCSRFKFTHAAEFMARTVIENALIKSRLKLPLKKTSKLVIPHATYTSPEIAGVGETPTAKSTPDGDCYTFSLDDNDRAILEGQTAGFVKIWTRRGSDEIIGGTVVAEAAGELIGQITMAMTHKLGLGAIASVIQPYPTQADAIRQAANAYTKTKFTPTAATVLGKLFAWTR